MRELELNLGYKFKDMSLLAHALTHKSYINESELTEGESYERLEFLGDAVLELVISEKLFSVSPELPEGEMTKLRASIVCQPSLVEISEKMGLSEYIKFSLGENKTGGKHRASILADCVESVIAAIYLDGGYDAARSFILEHFEPSIKSALSGDLRLDYKSDLQEWLLKKGCSAPVYKLVASEGPDHNKKFCSEIFIEGVSEGRAWAASKRESEKEAAKIAYKKLVKKS